MLARRKLSDERREFLRQYILACVRDSLLSLSDLKSLAAPGKVLKVLSQDINDVLREMARTGFGNIARAAGAALIGLVSDVITKKR